MEDTCNWARQKCAVVTGQVEIMRELNDFFMRPANVLNERERKKRTVWIRKDANHSWCTRNPIDANELEKSGEGRGREGTNKRINPELCSHCLSVRLRWIRSAQTDNKSVFSRYIQAATSPKDLVIVVDVSGSMKGLRLTIAKHTIKTILDTLGENDFVNIIAVSKPEASSDWTELSISFCFKVFQDFNCVQPCNDQSV